MMALNRLRKILYFSGTRADFGLMQSTLLRIHSDPALSIGVAVTGMHLSDAYGATIRDIVETGLPIVARIKVNLEPATGATTARSIGAMVAAFTDVLETERPDIVLTLGDRGEMLAAAIAAIHLNVPIAHVHGGERSGTVDEPVRHAISKLAHIHFAATAASGRRLIAMGEEPARVIVTGAPGLDGLTDLATLPRSVLWARQGFSEQRPTALLLFHPVLQEAVSASAQTKEVLSALLDAGEWQIVALMPNADSGSDRIRDALEAHPSPDLRRIVHLPRAEFVSYMKAVDVMIGNSSAGIIEAASFGTPVINIGNRQMLRERNENVTDVPPNSSAIRAALNQVRSQGRFPVMNIYGDGQAGARICTALKDTELGPSLLNKVLAY